MAVRYEFVNGGPPPGLRAGAVDHRLARRSLITEYRKGRLRREQVCDAHPELLRAAGQIGDPSTRDCPICQEAKLVHVTYVFGPRLPAFGRCITTKQELAKLNGRADPLTAYIVEVCCTCSWNHLVRTLPIGGRPRR